MKHFLLPCKKVPFSTIQIVSFWFYYFGSKLKICCTVTKWFLGSILHSHTYCIVYSIFWINIIISSEALFTHVCICIHIVYINKCSLRSNRNAHTHNFVSTFRKPLKFVAVSVCSLHFDCITISHCKTVSKKKKCKNIEQNNETNESMILTKKLTKQFGKQFANLKLSHCLASCNLYGMTWTMHHIQRSMRYTHGK